MRTLKIFFSIMLIHHDACLTVYFKALTAWSYVKPIDMIFSSFGVIDVEDDFLTLATGETTISSEPEKTVRRHM